MIEIKNEKEIKLMAEGGRILSRILVQLRKKAQVRVTTRDLDREAEELILAAGGKPSFKMVPNYKFATCMCVNEVVVHGLPADYKLREDDILGIDVGIFYKGLHTDMAWTVIIGNQEPVYSPRFGEAGRQAGQGKRRFLETGKKALKKAISAAREGNHVGDISRAIQETIEGAGFSVVRNLVGHGVGKKLHEDPQIPGFASRLKEKTPPLKRGMTLAIEVIYNWGEAEVVFQKDGWTVATKDGQISGLFEKTVAVTDKEPIVLTA